MQGALHIATYRELLRLIEHLHGNPLITQNYNFLRELLLALDKTLGLGLVRQNVQLDEVHDILAFFNKTSYLWQERLILNLHSIMELYQNSEISEEERALLVYNYYYVCRFYQQKIHTRLQSRVVNICNNFFRHFDKY